MNKDVIKVGNLSTGNSQAGTIYRTWGGISNIMCWNARLRNGIYFS